MGAATTGAVAGWLRLPGVEARQPLSAASCLALSRTLLGASRVGADGGRGGPDGVPEALVAAFARAGGRDPVLLAWLGDLDRDSGAEDALARLAAVVCDGFTAGADGPGGPAAEAEVLRDAARAADALGVGRRRFHEAVAAARLEALREFAYGAGHEINNPLANIATRAQALLAEEHDPERRRRLAVIVDQAFRGRDMIGGLMVFARPPKPAPAAIDAAALLTMLVDAVKPVAAARSARLDCSPPPAPVEVFVDTAHVVEALRLVAVNALEAIAPGGRVTVAARLGAGASPGCELVVADDGPGMDADTLRRAFDPFFSGREAGRGIGLGLPKAWRLLEANGGRVVVDSRPGGGTAVTVLLPLAPGQPRPT